MRDDGGIIERRERLARAVAALHPRQLAHAFHELVGTRRRVARLARLFADEPRREDVVTPAKQRAEELHLLG